MSCAPPVVACDNDHDPVPFFSLAEIQAGVEISRKIKSIPTFFAVSRRAKKNFVAQCADNSATVMEGWMVLTMPRKGDLQTIMMRRRGEKNRH